MKHFPDIDSQAAAWSRMHAGHEALKGDPRSSLYLAGMFAFIALHDEYKGVAYWKARADHHLREYRVATGRTQVTD